MKTSIIYTNPKNIRKRNMANLMKEKIKLMKHMIFKLILLSPGLMKVTRNG